MKKIAAITLAVSMAAGMVVNASAADVKNLKLAGNLSSDNNLKDAYAIDYAGVGNRDSFSLPDNWDNNGYNSDKAAPVLVYGDTKEYNVLLYNVTKPVDVLVNSGKVRVSTRKYSAKEANHNGTVLPGAFAMRDAYSSVGQFGVYIVTPKGRTIPASWENSTQDLETHLDFYAFDSKDTNGKVDAPSTSAGENGGTNITDGTAPSSGPSFLSLNDIEEYEKGVLSKFTFQISTIPTNEYFFNYGSGTKFLFKYTPGVPATPVITVAPPEPVRQFTKDAPIEVKKDPVHALAYIGAANVNGNNYLVASKDYIYYTLADNSVYQHKVAKGCFVDANGYPVNPDDKVEAAQYAYSNSLNDSSLGGGATIEKGTSGVVLTIKSTHGPRDTKIEDFKIEVDVRDGNTFFIEGASGYSNIRDVTDGDRLTNQEVDNKGCVYNFGQKFYDTARIRCTDYVDLYFNGNYDTNKENLRVSTDEIAEIKNYFEDYDIDFVNFIARPKFASPVTVIIDADKNSYIYEYNETTGDVTLMNDDKATYDSTDGWKFKANTLGIYLIFEEEYKNANVMADKTAS